MDGEQVGGWEGGPEDKALGLLEENQDEGWGEGGGE